MTLDPEIVGRLLTPSDRAWTELVRATLHHKNGWRLFVEEVKVRPPYCTLVTREASDGARYDFNTEAFAKGVFVLIEVDPARKDVITEVLINAIRSAEAAQQRAIEEQHRATEERKRRSAAEAAERATAHHAAEMAAFDEIAAPRRREDMRRREQANASGKHIEDWQRCLRERSVTRLTHVTRLQNLGSIARRGLWPVTDFAEFSESPIRNDPKRFDGHLDKVSLSVTHPNDPLFFKWHADLYKADTWVVISIDPAILWHFPCVLFPTNAARSGGRTALTPSESPSVLDFERLFAEPHDGKTRNEFGHRACDTTDPQAELMVRARIGPEWIRGIGVQNATDLNEVRQALGSELQLKITIERHLFDARPFAIEYRRFQRVGFQPPIAGSAVILNTRAFDDDLPF